MSDPTLSDNGFKSEKALVWTTLNNRISKLSLLLKYVFQLTIATSVQIDHVKVDHCTVDHVIAQPVGWISNLPIHHIRFSFRLSFKSQYYVLSTKALVVVKINYGNQTELPR